MPKAIAKLTIAVDFDGTIVYHAYPNIVDADIGSIDVLLNLQALGHKMILYTMRSGKQLTEAIDWCADKGLEFDHINSNPSQKKWTQSPKIYANIYIDDAALGIPLREDKELGERPFVDWTLVENLLIKQGVL
jgi:hypothetical protein